MHQVTVDIEQRVAIRPVHHDVALPDLLEHGPRGGHRLGPLLLGGGFEFVAEGGAAVVPFGGAEAGERLGRRGLYQRRRELAELFTSASGWSQIAMMLPSSRPGTMAIA